MRVHKYSNEYDLARYFLNEYDASDAAQSLIIKNAEEILKTVSPKDARAAELLVNHGNGGHYLVHAQMKGSDKLTNTTSMTIVPSPGKLDITVVRDNAMHLVTL